MVTPTVKMERYGKTYLVLGKQFNYGDGHTEVFPKSFKYEMEANKALEEAKSAGHNFSKLRFGGSFRSPYYVGVLVD